MEILLLLENTTREKACEVLEHHRTKASLSEPVYAVEYAFDPEQNLYIFFKITNPYDIPNYLAN